MVLPDSHRLGWVACLSLLVVCPADAELLLPGDARMRHDIQLLADAGIIDAPITGWPIFFTDFAIDPSLRRGLDPGGLAALQRVFPAREVSDSFRLDATVGGISEPERFRSFQKTPREQGELSARMAGTAGRFAYDVTATWVDDPLDNREWRADGSYAGVAFGNWFAALSVTDRWWGPGWDGSLVLSSNARPIPSISIQRRRALPPGIRWLRWLGPWTMQALFGQLESDRAVPDARFFGWRFGFKPFPRLEIGLSRTAQWCGDGRPCGFDTFLDLLSGIRDNTGDNISAADEPGNQLAGFDVRYSFDSIGRPWAFYSQWIGEDEANGLPSAYLALLGLETWGTRLGGGRSYRLHAEYSETTCSALTDSDPNFVCAYNHGIYTDGYRYRGRAIGHTMDGDGVMFSLGGLWVDSSGNAWQILGRRVEVNRSNHPSNTVSPLKQDVYTLEVSHTRDFGFSELTVGLGHEDGEFTDSGTDFDETRVFANWVWRLSGGN